MVLNHQLLELTRLTLSRRSFQAPSAVLACVDSQQLKFLNGKMLPYVFIPH